MSTISDIPLYDIIQEIEQKHGHEKHMSIEIITNDDATTDQPHPIVRGEDLYRPNGWQLNDGIFFWCEFENQVAVFDNVASVRHWFLHDCDRENPDDNTDLRVRQNYADLTQDLTIDEIDPEELYQ